MSQASVLISGAGVAGPTLAFFLVRAGHAVTVVERSDAARSSGPPVDVRGPAVEVVREMGVESALRAARVHRKWMTLLREDGSVQARIDTDAFDRSADMKDMELPRSTLARLLAAPTQDTAEYVYGDTVVALAQDERGVEVTFQHAPPRRFDFVVGADGLHSRVRALAFGSEAQFAEHLGMYFATMPLGENLTTDGELFLYNRPDRLTSIHPVHGDPMVAFIFRTGERVGNDPRAFIARHYQHDGWRVPELLEKLRTSQALYFDSISRVRMPGWSKGRVVLLGDAASCASLFGEGSSNAIVGARALAAAVSAHPANLREAFGAYERKHRPRVEAFQRGMGLGSRLIVPRSQWGIATRGLVARASTAVTGVVARARAS